MSKISVSLSKEDWEKIIEEKERSKSSNKEFWYKKRNHILEKLHNLDLDEHTEKELLLAILEMNTKIYWELRKLNDKK